VARRGITNAAQTGAPTSADVARLAGVSQATISLVLNGRASNVRISNETRDRVMSAAEPGEEHESGSDAGMTVLVVEAESLDL